MRIVLGVLAALLSGVGPSPAGQSCESLTGLVLDGTTITEAAVVSAGTYCRVTGVVAPSNNFEVWLPVTGWNGKYMGVGNGALGGYINFFGMQVALARGYATGGTDNGHQGGLADASWAVGHPELVVEFGHRSVHTTTVTAKAVVAAFYGVAPARSYFLGCSTGGRQGLMEAQRYPEDYEGVVAGAPANPLTQVAVAGNWVSQALHDDPEAMIPEDLLPLIADAVVARCDARDGVEDGLLEDPRRCRWNPRALRCPRDGGTPGSCLTTAQVKALKRVYAGPRTSSGKRIFPGFVPGGEIAVASGSGPAGEPSLDGWEGWIVGTALPVGHFISETLLKHIVFEDPTWDWRTFDFDRDPRFAAETAGVILDAVDPDLTAFRARGGKIVMYHGWSDPAIPPGASIQYYERVRATMGRRETPEFFRLFMAPGMQHCAGGPGASSFDAIGALEAWVEDGSAPDAIVATHLAAGVAAFTRTLCPYPQVARYDGTGDPDEAASFTCGKARR
jgi:feruloyl esterase